MSDPQIDQREFNHITLSLVGLVKKLADAAAPAIRRADNIGPESTDIGKIREVSRSLEGIQKRIEELGDRAKRDAGIE